MDGESNPSETTAQPIDATVALAAAIKTTDTRDVNDKASAGASPNQHPDPSIERHWDATSRKVVVHNVLKFIRPNELSKLTASWTANTNLVITKTKKPPKDNWIKVTLEKDEMVNDFITLINTGGKDGGPMTNERGGNMYAKRASEMDDRDNGGRGKRGREDDNAGGRDAKRRSAVSRVLTSDEVRDAITPLWRKTYQEQLDDKAKEMVNKCSKNIVKEIKKKFRTLEHEARRGHRSSIQQYSWLTTKRVINVEQPVPSPLVYEYRNKVEFTAGWRNVRIEKESKDTSKSTQDESKSDKASDIVENGANGDETDATDIKKIPAAGFLASGWAGGVTSPHCLQNTPDWACSVADILNSYLPTSPLKPYDSKIHRGFFRSFTVRCSLRTREIMVIVVHAPAKGGVGAMEDGSDDFSAVFEEEKKKLITLLTGDVLKAPKRDFPDGFIRTNGINGESCEGLKVTSVFFQEFEGLSQPGPDHPVQHVFGKNCIEEQLGSCAFQISPGAFFQTNTRGAEKLYSIVVDRIREVTTDPKQTLLFDVCCGTGTIGLTCLKEGVVGKLLGVDIAEPAILDAKVNAAKNGFSTDDTVTRFIASPAEKVLAEEMKSVPKSTPVVAVVDPARDGLHGTVVQCLRKNEKIERLVYVSCNPTGTLVRDAAMLCAPPTKKYPGRPFKPILAQPVDMFPLTSHCEMVMTFERMTEEEYTKYHNP